MIIITPLPYYHFGKEAHDVTARMEGWIGTISTDGNAIRADSYTPTELIKAVVAAGMQTFMQMQGGRQPGGPGGL